MNATEPQSYQEFDSLPVRVVGILHSPRAVFAAVIVHPRWAAVMMMACVVTAVCSAALMETEVGRLALVDQWERTWLAFGRPVDDAQYARFEAMSAHGAVYAVARALASGPLLAFGLSALLFTVFSRVGGRASYRQVLAIVVHASVILALRQALAAPVAYTRETMASPTSMVLFFTMLDEASPAARFFGIIDLFVLWWVVVLAVGMSMLYRRPARPIILAFVGSYVGCAAAAAVAMAVIGGAV